MTSETSCQICGGLGVYLDPDPVKPARPCQCVSGYGLAQRMLDGIPSRYRNASINSFWELWQGHNPVSKIADAIGEAYEELMSYKALSVGSSIEEAEANGNDVYTRAVADDELVLASLNSQLELIIHKCGLISKLGSHMCWRDLMPAQEPAGYRSILSWAKNEIRSSDFWWIHGKSPSGRSTLAAAILKTWCEHHGDSGLFVSVRSIGLGLKDTRNFRDPDYRSELDRMEPLLNAPILVLDDFDCAEKGQRIAQYLAQLLDHRYNEELPTIFTASYGVDTLAIENKSNSNIVGDSKNCHPLVDLGDQVLLNRLYASKRVVLSPTITTLMSALKPLTEKVLDKSYNKNIKSNAT